MTDPGVSRASGRCCILLRRLEIMRLRKHRASFAFLILCASALAAGGCVKTITDPQEVEKSPQARAYRAYVRAIQDGNWLDLMRSVTSDVSERLQMLPGSEQHLAMFRESLASDIKFIKLRVEGRKAVLSATGKAQGVPATCEIQLRLQGKLWRVEKDDWQPTGKAVLPL